MSGLVHWVPEVTGAPVGPRGPVWGDAWHLAALEPLTELRFRVLVYAVLVWVVLVVVCDVTPRLADRLFSSRLFGG